MPDDPTAYGHLLEATRLLYHTFAKCRGADNWVDGADDLSDEYCERPVRASAKKLSDEDVDYFFSHAICMLDEKERTVAIKYFLGRVLETYVPQERSSKISFAGAWFVGEQLRKHDWRNWPNGQMQPIATWFDAWLDVIVIYQPTTTPNPRWPFDISENRELGSWLKFARKLDLNTARLVASVTMVDDLRSARLVESCLSEFGKTLLRKQVLWDALDIVNQKPLMRWLLAYRTEQRLENAFFHCRTPAEERFVSKTLESLRDHKASLPTFDA